MRYCLVHKKSHRVVPLFCKRELLHWIYTHFYCLSDPALSSWSLHRMRIYQRGTHGHYLVMAGDFICSLRDYVSKHKINPLKLNY